VDIIDGYDDDGVPTGGTEQLIEKTQIWPITKEIVLIKQVRPANTGSA
jgi:hypothetical protein